MSERNELQKLKTGPVPYGFDTPDDFEKWTGMTGRGRRVRGRAGKKQRMPLWLLQTYAAAGIAAVIIAMSFIRMPLAESAVSAVKDNIEPDEDERPGGIYFVQDAISGIAEVFGIAAPVSDMEMYPPSSGRIAETFSDTGTGIKIVSDDEGGVYASDDGAVFHADKNGIVIDHGGGIKSCYFYVRDIRVREGQAVRRGERIAEKMRGDDGWYMEYRLLYGGRPVDPATNISGR